MEKIIEINLTNDTRYEIVGRLISILLNLVRHPFHFSTLHLRWQRLGVDLYIHSTQIPGAVHPSLNLLVNLARPDEPKHAKHDA